MKPHDAKAELEKSIAELGSHISALTPPETVRLMIGFYRHSRVEGAALDLDQDMLLYEWGMYDRGQGRSFLFDITRQFIESGTEDEDGMSQLSLTCFFKPTPALEALGTGEKWCHSPAELVEFKNFVLNSEPYQAVSHETPDSVSLDYNEV